VGLGSGEGAKYIGWTLAKQGNHVATIERKYIGGSCPNIAFLPSKNLVTAPEWLPIFEEPKNPESRKIISGSACPWFAILSEKWSRAWLTCTSRVHA
jgi:pyruvate/2-oxoglutarate dehydrogenase complex dihydrolipoamide dehydrogenase (E3) component